jgi:hypothetical protein
MLGRAMAGERIAIRPLRGSDAASLVECFRRCYAGTYVADGSLRSVVAVAPGVGGRGSPGVGDAARPGPRSCGPTACGTGKVVPSKRTKSDLGRYRWSR